MQIKGLLVEAPNGEHYLLGIGPRATGTQTERPTIWRVSGAQFESLEETRSASSTIRETLDVRFLYNRALPMTSTSSGLSSRL
jgi:hypothetical protein